MRILAIDVGTGTQDILLVDTDGAVENSLKLIMPSPTLIVGRRVRAATRRGDTILFEGPMMGGGPAAWALRDHALAGLPLFATPDAARTLDDDLARVTELGVRIVSEDEAATLRVDERLQSGDLMLGAVHTALAAFGVAPEYDVLAVAVFDHGNAPPGASDRAFRFDSLRRLLSGNGGLTEFAHARGAVPSEMTRLRAVEASAPEDSQLLVMDTGPAAILGALEDPAARPTSEQSSVVVNVGNFHCLAFHMSPTGVLGLFEHHTGELTREQLEGLIESLADGSLTNEEVFESMGHGALVLGTSAAPHCVAVVGPQRNLLSGSRLRPLRAVPHGDQMLAGCYGLLRGVAARLPRFADEIVSALESVDVRQPGW